MGLFVFVLLVQFSCNYLQKMNELRDKAEADLDVICKNIPIPHDFIAAKSDKTLDVGKVVISREFRSNASCEVVKNHFFEHFITLGWNRDRMEVEQSRGGMESLDFIFRDADYLVWVSCQSDVQKEAAKQIGISCSWGLRK